ncbi:MAG: sodium-dependent transporter [Gammaproteobacteria bacterium]|jgi:NSS family neurotransmitter:Na+ symporter|nr:sodium-dependent transporter [Gammaproteobacteria bacterium]MDP6615729.1 sodium-dependent transporter [Gammaproteobacteria bacterium]MDP6695260.1 sodium-dependent transporter [Gammaproteobacteria bacterium]
MAQTDNGNGGRSSLHGFWSSRLAFILAVTGSAVGLGNIWKFPYVAGENGGGAFVLVYLLCVFGIGLPIMMSEVLLGRRGRRNPVASMALLGEEEGGTRSWSLIGLSGVVAGFLILSFYSVIAGWVFAYIFKSAAGDFAGADAETVKMLVQSLEGSWVVTGAWHTVFMALTVFFVARGVERGLEVAVTLMVPALIVILVLLLGYSMTSGEFEMGVRFLFEPDFSRLSAASVLAAMGQAFFTLSIGMGCVMAYGAYLPQETSIPGTAFAVVCADTAIALLSGLVIFPIVFASGLDPTAGPELIFQALPLSFGNMPFGTFFGTLFFLLVGFAALTSAISLMEPAVAWAVETFSVTRARASVSIGLIIWALGFLSVLSFNALSDFTFWQGTFLDNLDYLTSNIMLPLGGLLITVFCGWVMCRNGSAAELDVGTGTIYQAWYFLTRFVAPLAVVLVFLNAVGLLDWFFELL